LSGQEWSSGRQLKYEWSEGSVSTQANLQVGKH